MTDERYTTGFDADGERARRAVRELSRPQAEDAFRARLREEFVRGALSVRAPGPGAGRAPAPRPRWRRLAPLAVAAAVVVLVLGPWMRDPALNITAVEGTRQILLNGELVDCADLSPIQAALQPGCDIHVPDGATVTVASAGQVAMDLEGVEFTFPTPPYRWLGGRFDSKIAGDGTVRMATGPEFSGSSYRLRLGDAELLTRGSVFTVSREGGRIGINVLEGELEAVLPDGSRRRVGPRSGAMIHQGEFLPQEFDDAEVERLDALRERVAVG